MIVASARRRRRADGVLASLPMYDLPEVRAATDALWRGIAAAFEDAGLEDVPAQLSRGTEEAVWCSQALLFSQTCGYPLTHRLAGVVEPVATPSYSAEGCDGPEYCSLLVVAEGNPAEDLASLRGSVCAYNRSDSHSGYNALRFAVAPLAGGEAFFARTVESGAHADSIALVANAEADVCAVDCVTHALLARHRPRHLDGTRVLCATARAPGLPYVTRAGIERARMSRMREALQAAFSEPRLDGARDALLLTGIHVLDSGVYRRIDDMERSARAADYAEIH